MAHSEAADPGLRAFSFASATGQGIFNQIVDVIKRDFVDSGENFESPRRLVLEKNHDRRFHRRTTGLHAGNLFDDDGRIRREGQNGLNPVAYLVQRKGRNVLLPTERVDIVGRGRAIVRSDAVHETLSDFLFV